MTLMVFWADPQAHGEIKNPGQGKLTIIAPDGKPGDACPLEHTSVNAEISGFVTRVTVKQIFHNPTDEKIEAVYTFPLSSDGAVDHMVMKVGDRVVKGVIKKREEARQIYERARDRGQVASLLDQERPNIFTQSVANIMPGQKIEIIIKYSEILPYSDGAFKFVFPMVVGPRFIPGKPAGNKGTGWAKDTDQVPDASRITPPVAKKGKRAGHDIDLTVSIDAGVKILDLKSELHEVETTKDGNTKATVALKNKKEIPNRDFVLKCYVAGEEIKSGVITHKDGDEGYVTVIMIPPKRVQPDQIAPKEMIFVIDCSGSQNGRPLDKAKETMKYVIDNLNPNDTFNIIDFNVNARMLFSEPKKNTPESRATAQEYLKSLRARGGTWMGPAIKKVVSEQAPENRLRIVTFMTDGYVGNDFEIISLVKDLRGESRWFPFGTGNSVNRFLLDNMARVGGGEVEYVLLNSKGKDVAKKFYKRIASPVLTDIKLKFENLEVDEVFPGEISDLWDRKPLVFKGKYKKAGKGAVKITGFSGGKPYEQTLELELPEREKANKAIGSIWARAKVDALMDENWMAAQRGKPKEDIKNKIIEVALKHSIMTQYTSFVAVEETTITEGGKPRRITVPVEMPDGVSREGVFGDSDGSVTHGASVRRSVAKRAPSPPTLNYNGKAPMGARHKGASVSANQLKVKKESLTSTQRAGIPQSAPNEIAAQAPEPSLEMEEKVGEADMSDEVRQTSASKLAPELRRLARLFKEHGKEADYSKADVSVEHGKVSVKVWVQKINDKLIKKLEKAGLEIIFKASTGKMIIGKIDIEKLEDLANAHEIRLIEPLEIKKG